VYQSDHKDILRRRREWADCFDGVQTAMWWIRAGTIPEATEAVERLESLERLGPLNTPSISEHVRRTA